MTPRRSTLLWAIFGAAWALLFHRLLLGDALYWGLPALQFIPWRMEALDLLRAGELPLWQTLNGAGAPLLANYQSALLYPLSWPSFILPVAWSMSVIAALHLLIAAAGMAALGGALGFSPLARTVSAIAFALCGYLTARLGTFPIIQAAAWLPWLLWACLRLVDEASARRAATLAAIAALLLLAGHAQTAWYALLLAGLFTLYRWLAHPARRPIALAACIGGIVLAGGIAALQLAATAELLSESARSGGVDRDFALNYSYAPARAFNLIAPQAFGTPADGSYITGGAYFEDAVYIGLIPLLGAIAAAIAAFRRTSPRGPIGFWIAVAIVGFILALGRHSPIFPFLFDTVPTFDLFQAPVRWHIWTVTALCILAGYGVSAWHSTARARLWSRRALIAGVGAVIAVTVGLSAFPDNAAIQRLGTGLALAAAWGIAACLLTLVQPPESAARRRLWEAGVVAIVCADLLIAAWGLNPTVPASFYDPQPGAEAGADRLYWPPEALDAYKFGTLLRFDDFRVVGGRIAEYRAAALPNLNMLDGIPVFNNFDPLLPAGHLDYSDLLAGDPTPALLRAAGIGTVYRADGWQRADLASRAWLVGSACWHAASDEVRAALGDPGWNPRAIVHLTGEGGCDAPRSAGGGAAITADSGAGVTITVTGAEDAAWLVLADTAYPGWTATVDGQPAPIHTANLAFRAVPIPAGESVVQMRYAPAWIVPGAIVSAVSLVILLLLARLSGDSRERGV